MQDRSSRPPCTRARPARAPPPGSSGRPPACAR